jgi:hypothetical protein
MKRPSQVAIASIIIAALTALLGSCGDPVHDGQVAALGGEAPGVPQGEFHRAGQPCGVCHGPDGPASLAFTLAGTVFAQQFPQAVGVDVAQVLFVDDNQAHFNVNTNCVGNFFITANDWNPAFPVKAGVSVGGPPLLMQSHISREVSCANCHRDPPGLDSPGHIYTLSTPNPMNPSCPVSPVAGGN